MRVKEGFVLREVAGQAVVIATGEASRDFHGLIRLNETGCRIWRGLEAGLEREAIAESLAAEFDVSPADALADVDSLVARMEAEGLLA